MGKRESTRPVAETTKIGRRGTIVIPAVLRRLFDLEEGTPVKIEELEGRVGAGCANTV